MNGFIKKTVAGCCLSASLVFVASGCVLYREHVDPCWPERYNSIAKHNVNYSLNVQADRGHMLQQTIWNWHFEADVKTGAPTDKLNGAGMEILRRITRTMPAPDFQIYLQTAQDFVYKDNTAPEKVVAQRQQLDERRIRAIQLFLATQTPLHGGGAYQVAVHDIAPPGLTGTWTPYSLSVIETRIKSGQPMTLVQPPSAVGGK